MRRLLWAALALALLLPVSAFAADSLLVDNVDPGYQEIDTGHDWFTSSVGWPSPDDTTSRFCVRDTCPMAAAQWTPPCSTADTYNIYYYLPSTENSSDSALYFIHHSTGDDSVYKNQNEPSGVWVFLGAYDMPGDSSGYVQAINDTSVTSAGFAFRTDAMLWEAVGDTQDIHLVHYYHDFGILETADSLFWTFDFSNVGGDPLTVSDISATGPHYTVTEPTSFPLEVQPGATVDVTVRFQPLAGGTFLDSVQIASDDPDTSEWVRKVQLEGRSGILVVDDGDAGYTETAGTTWTDGGGYEGDCRWAYVSTDPGATAEYVFNVPAADTYNAFYFYGVTGSDNAATAAKFKIHHASGADSVYRDMNLRSNEYWQFLGQHPFNTGTSGKVEIINDPNAPGWGGYALRCDAIKLEPPTAGPDLYVIDYRHDYGDVTQGLYADWSFMAHNIGDSTVTIDNVRTSHTDFTVVSAPDTIAAGVTETITVRFSPSVQEEYNERVTVYSDDGELAPFVYLIGNGTGALVIVDNEDGAPPYTEQPDSLTGNHWHNSGSGWLGLSRYNDAADDSLWDGSSEYATFTPDIPVADGYDVWWYIVSTTWVSGSVEYRVHPSIGPDYSTRINQVLTGNVWKYLGTWYFDTDDTGYVQIVADTTAFDNGPVVRADAFKFVQAKGDTIPPETVDDLTIEKSGDDISLSWTEVSDTYMGVDYYIVFRSATPEFTPTPGDSLGEALTGEYLDLGAVGSDYYYEVQAVDNVGLKGDFSNQVGEVDVDLSNVK